VEEDDSLKVQLQLQGFQHLLTHKGTFPVPITITSKKTKKQTQNYQIFSKESFTKLSSLSSFCITLEKGIIKH